MKKAYKGIYPINTPTITHLNATLPVLPPANSGSISPLSLSNDNLTSNPYSYVEVPLRYEIKLSTWQIIFQEEMRKQKPKGSILFVQCLSSGNGATSFIKHMVGQDRQNIFINLRNLSELPHVMQEMISKQVYPKNIFIDMKFARNMDGLIIESLKTLSDGLYSCTPKYPRSLVHEVDNIVVFSPYIPREIVFINPDFLTFWKLSVDIFIKCETMDIIKSLGYEPKYMNVDEYKAQEDEINN